VANGVAIAGADAESLVCEPLPAHDASATPVSMTSATVNNGRALAGNRRTLAGNGSVIAVTRRAQWLALRSRPGLEIFCLFTKR
jgi:hypothetical protein